MPSERTASPSALVRRQLNSPNGKGLSAIMQPAIMTLLGGLLNPRYPHADSYEQLQARTVALFTLFGAVACSFLLAIPTLLGIRGDILAIYISFALLSFSVFAIALILVHVGQLRWSLWLTYGLLITLTILVFSSPLGRTGVVMIVPLTVLFGALLGKRYGAVVTLIVVLSAGVLLLPTSFALPQLRDAAFNPLGADLLPFEVVMFFLLTSGIALIGGALVHEMQRLLDASDWSGRHTRSVLDIVQIMAKFPSRAELFPRTVNYIRDRFGIDHVQLFLVDQDSRFANLVASTGEAGRELIARQYRISLTSPSALARTITNGEVNIAVMSDEQLTLKGKESIARFSRHLNELLPATKSEMVLPLIMGDQIIGALDLQSNRTNAFSSNTTENWRLLANQLALTIQSVQQTEQQAATLLATQQRFEEAEKAARESQLIAQRLTGQAWRDYVRSQLTTTVGYTFANDVLRSDQQWTRGLERAYLSRNPTIHRDGQVQAVSVPIELRGQVIGAIEVELGTDAHGGEALEMIQAVAQRLAVSVDNARLFEQTQELAQQEFELNSISAKIQGVTDVQELVKVALHELSSAINADTASIRLGELTPAPRSAQ